MERIKVTKNYFLDKPLRVYELDETHYFYWPLELGLKYITLYGRKFPVFPLKDEDFEPIKVIDKFGNKSVLSRFHYDILLYFSKPRLKDNIPIATFFPGSHSPFVYSELSNDFLGSRVKDPNIENTNKAMKYLGMYLFLMSNLKNFSDFFDDYSIHQGSIPDDALFNPLRMEILAWFGKRPTEEEFDFLQFPES